MTSAGERVTCLPRTPHTFFLRSVSLAVLAFVFLLSWSAQSWYGFLSKNSHLFFICSLKKEIAHVLAMDQLTDTDLNSFMDKWEKEEKEALVQTADQTEKSRGQCDFQPTRERKVRRFKKHSSRYRRGIE